MILIGTDEAGYGPKLGPLVVTATVWRVKDRFQDSDFDHLTEGPRVDTRGGLRIVDSKALFQPRKKDSLSRLQAIVLAAWQWFSEESHRQGDLAKEFSTLTLQSFLEVTAPQDLQRLLQRPWFAANLFASEINDLGDSSDCGVTRCRALIQHWHSSSVRLLTVRQRILDAKFFNQCCRNLGNKASVLSEITLALVAELLSEYRDEDALIYSDRHGGRAYYAGVLQHLLEAGNIEILCEDRQTSRYRLQHLTRQVHWQFQVKGDTFAPVAMASIFAKYTRERLMGCFNAFWCQAHQYPLRPTAGYPVDAARFLAEIEPARIELGVTPDDLVRQR